MTDIARITISLDVGRPFEFGRVGVSRANITGLKLFELLLGSQFIGLTLSLA